MPSLLSDIRKLKAGRSDSIRSIGRWRLTIANADSSDKARIGIGHNENAALHDRKSPTQHSCQAL
jgi:hypothetical protein